MSYLFFIDEKNCVLLHPDCYKLSPVLRELDQKEMLFIILAYDNFSMYRQIPEDDRVRRAMHHVWKDNKPKLLKDPKIIDAIREYKSLQYNPKIDLANKLQEKIDNQLKKFLADDESPTANKNALALISECRQQIRDLEKEVVEEELSKNQIRGDKKISMIEDLMKNQSLYKSVIAPKT